MFGDKNTYSPESSHFQSPSDCDKRPCPRELKFPQRGHTRHTGGPELWSGHVEDRQTETDRVTETGGRGGGVQQVWVGWASQEPRRGHVR